ncbi:MAG: peptidylprolyl isomerase [Candidatus Aenigmarchaeota archaeon]|nr:peptidylprolyl isomerase [Candidatus Aenigmarchaeota archaeon]
MKEGDFVYIDFTGRAKDTDEVFDTTIEEMAKLAGIHNPKTVYTPVPIIIGASQLIPGLDEAIKEMNVGDKKKIELQPDKAFGERNSELVKLFPMSIFKQNNIDPEPGRVVTFNGTNGKILNIDGGRIKVDFNHPLAGKVIQYDLEIKSEITESNEKAGSVFQYYTGIKDNVNVTMNDSQVSISTERADFPKQVKQQIADTIIKWVDGISKVSFVDVFEKGK